jgi:hypothetical protein
MKHIIDSTLDELTVYRAFVRRCAAFAKECAPTMGAQWTKLRDALIAFSGTLNTDMAELQRFRAREPLVRVVLVAYETWAQSDNAQLASERQQRLFAAVHRLQKHEATNRS